MVDRPDKSDRGDVRPDEILNRIVPDPTHPDVKRLTGFLMGKSDRDDRWRLYLTVDLDHYVEFSKEDTLHAQQFRPGRTTVWLKKDARLAETVTRTRPIDFLRGDLLGQFLRRRGADFLGAMVGSPMRLMEADGSGCAHLGCSAGCTPGYGCGGGDTIGYTCGC